MHVINLGKIVRTAVGASLLLSMLSFGLIGCASLGDGAAPQHSAVAPTDRLSQEWWGPRHEGVLNQNEAVKPDILMIGDSITHGWDGNMEIWESHFGEYSMVNMGFGGDRTQHVLWRLNHGEIKGVSPKLAVLMIGTNNSNRSDNTAEEIGDGIVAICEELRAELPDMEILVLAIFPRGEGPSSQREKNAAASKIAKKYARSDSHIHYLDFGDAFLDSDMTLPSDIMPDFLHPNAKGYKIWASEMENEVIRLVRR